MIIPVFAGIIFMRYAISLVLGGLMRFATFLIGILFSMATFADNVFSITSSSIPSNGKIPVVYSCDGKNISPELSFNHAPPSARSFTLVISDPDAPKGTFYHWVVINLPSTIKSLPENADPLTEGAIVLRNTSGKNEYMGPCPPKGSTHTYLFTLYALDSNLTLTKESEANDVFAGINGHVVAKAELRAKFGRS